MLFPSAQLFADGHLVSAAVLSPTGFGLADLLGRQTFGAVPAAAIEDVVTGATTVSLTERATVSLTDLERAAERLRHLHSDPGSPRDVARLFFLERIARATHPPHPLEAIAFLEERLDLYEAAVGIYKGLSPVAKEALYILLTEGGVPPRSLNCFLGNQALSDVSGGHERILQMVSHLYNYGVENFGSAFIPTTNDDKFLSAELGRLNSLVEEFRQAFWFALMTDATRVVMGVAAPLNQSLLTEGEQRFLAEKVNPFIDERRRDYDDHVDVKADLAVERRRKIRLVEVKSFAGGDFRPGEETTAKILLQLIHYGLAVRTSGLEGIEYVIQAPDVSPAFSAALVGALELTGCRYLLRVIGGATEHYSRRGLTYPVTYRHTPQQRTRPLPPLPGRNEVADRSEEVRTTPRTAARRSDRPRAVESQETDLPWTREVKDFLLGVWPKGRGSPSSPKRLRNANEFVESVQNGLRRVPCLELLTNLEMSLASCSDPSVAAFLRAELQTMRALFSTQVETLSRDYVRRFVRFAALYTGALPLPATEASGGLVGEEGLLQRSCQAIESQLLIQLDDWESALKGLEEISEDAHAGSPHDWDAFLGMVDECSPDVPFFRQWTIRQVRDAMKATPNVGWNKDLIRRLDEAIERFDRLKDEER